MYLYLAMIPVAVIGGCLNILIILIRSQRCMRKSSVNVLLIGLAVTDAGLLSLGSMSLVPFGIFEHYKVNNTAWYALDWTFAHTWTYILPFALIFQTAGTYILILITIERYLAVCVPFRAYQICTKRNSIIGLCCVAIIAVVFNITRFMENDIIYTAASNTTSARVSIDPNAKQRKFGPTYNYVYTMWLYLLVMFVFPFSIIIVLNLKIICEVKAIKARSRQHSFYEEGDDNENSTTTMLLIIIFIFLLTKTLPFALRIYVVTFFEKQRSIDRDRAHFLTEEQYIKAKRELTASFAFEAYSTLRSVSNFLVMLSCAINFPIYYGFSEQFRRGLEKVLPFCKMKQDPRSRNTATSETLVSFSPGFNGVLHDRSAVRMSLLDSTTNSSSN